MKEKVREAIQVLQEQNILEQIAYSRCATPIVIVPKKSGALRICADYKVTVNRSLDKMFYPLQTLDDILHKMEGADTYVVLDLHQASKSLKRY